MTHEVRWTVLDNGDFSFQTVDVITRGFLSQWTPVLKEFQHVRLTTIPRLEAVNHGPDHWKNPFVPKQNWFLASVYLTKKISHLLPIRFWIYLPPSTQSWFICFLMISSENNEMVHHFHMQNIAFYGTISMGGFQTSKSGYNKLLFE